MTNEDSNRLMHAGEFTPPMPKMEFLARFEVNLGSPIEVGSVGLGKRRVIPITGGRFRGEEFNGTILDGGADWQLVQPDGVARIDTRYGLRTDSGAPVYISTKGVRHGNPDVVAALAGGVEVDPAHYYFRITLDFETGDPEFQWLNSIVAIGSGIRRRSSVVYDAYVVR